VTGPEWLRFPALAALDGLEHGFVGRVPGVDVDATREEAVARLWPFHRRLIDASGLGPRPLVLAEQVHGAEVALVEGTSPAALIAGADGLITSDRGICLGIYVADCCAVFLADPRHAAIGLVHAGRKGTELGILPAAIGQMGLRFGSDPAEIIVQLGPCIRPPRYETDFAAALRAQAFACGVRHLHDCGLCTGADTRRWYSYRIERGRTGRMLAVFGLR
jgi:copper oxidase (laccase) domain-containing protein